MDGFDRYVVVLNEEDQYSIWPADRPPPNGWTAVGVLGSRDECLDHIERVWTDMRPRSVRLALANPPAEPDDLPADPDGPDLVTRLSDGWHPVEVVLRPERSAAAFAACLEREYVCLRFTGTRGGTDLGFAVPAAEQDVTGGDLNAATGRVRLSGRLRLDGVPVRCLAEIDLTTLAGTGRLEV